MTSIMANPAVHGAYRFSRKHAFGFSSKWSITAKFSVVGGSYQNELL